MELTRREMLAGTAAGMVAAAMNADLGAAAADEAAYNPNHAGEKYNFTFDNGPLTAAEQHAPFRPTTGRATS